MLELAPTLANSAAALRLLGILQPLGFDDESFWRLHHFRNKNKRETIRSFSTYCHKTHNFPQGHNNHRVVCRLSFLFESYVRGSEQELGSISGELERKLFFEKTADAAYRHLPAVDG